MILPAESRLRAIRGYGQLLAMMEAELKGQWKRNQSPYLDSKNDFAGICEARI